MKKEIHLGGGRSIAAPISPFATLGSPIYPRHPYRPKARRGQGAMPQPSCRSTDHPNGPVGAREAVCIGQANESRLTWWRPQYVEQVWESQGGGAFHRSAVGELAHEC